MTQTPETTPFVPKQSRIEAKHDAVTRAALEIIQSEKAARVAKTERLRAARLAQEDAARLALAKSKPTTKSKTTKPKVTKAKSASKPRK